MGKLDYVSAHSRPPFTHASQWKTSRSLGCLGGGREANSGAGARRETTRLRWKREEKPAKAAAIFIMHQCATLRRAAAGHTQAEWREAQPLASAVGPTVRPEAGVFCAPRRLALCYRHSWATRAAGWAGGRPKWRFKLLSERKKIMQRERRASGTPPFG